jgi:hypothetical protein
MKMSENLESFTSLDSLRFIFVPPFAGGVVDSFSVCCHIVNFVIQINIISLNVIDSRGRPGSNLLGLEVGKLKSL